MSGPPRKHSVLNVTGEFVVVVNAPLAPEHDAGSTAASFDLRFSWCTAAIPCSSGFRIVVVNVEVDILVNHRLTQLNLRTSE